jgi:Spy/CpxP family protein refolding chaperone
MKFISNSLFRFALLLAMLTLANTAQAQTEEPSQEQGRHERGRRGKHKGDGKIEAARIGYLTSKLDLTEVQAKDFWPIHNEYSKKRKEILMQMRQLKRDIDVDNLTEDQAALKLKLLFELRENEVKLEREYSKRFLKVLTNVQLVKYFQAEIEFTRMLLKRLGKRDRQPPIEE